jgi:hypothetical protein
MFSISADFSMDDVEAYIKQETDVWFDELVDSFRKTGRSLVDKARAKTSVPNGFNNITWNLRGSICMALAYEGRIIETYSPPITKGEHGTELGKDIAERIAIYSQGQEGIVMAIVAAEEYAIFVERTGRDVITHVVGDSLGDELNKILK